MTVFALLVFLKDIRHIYGANQTLWCGNYCALLIVQGPELVTIDIEIIREE